METVINEFGQRVRVVEWDEFNQRLRQRKPYTGKEDLNGKTLVIKHTWGIGDILYSTPALKALKEKFPSCKIIYICSFPKILEGNPYVDCTYHWLQFEDFMDIGDNLKGEMWYFLNYDVPLKGGFDYKVHLRTKPALNEYLLSLLKKNPKILVGQEREFVEQASNTVISRYRLVALDMYCWHAFVDPPEKTVYYYPTFEELNWADSFLSRIRKAGNRAIILIPHTSTLYKDYPHWKEVIRILPKNYSWIILGSVMNPAERWIGSNTYDCSGSIELRASFALAMQADLCCSSDTGLLYPRAAKGKPCIVTYGPHEPQPFLHYFPSAYGMRIEKLRTTPGMEGMCSTGCFIDTTACKEPNSYAPCMRELSPEPIAEKIFSLLG